MRYLNDKSSQEIYFSQSICIFVYFPVCNLVIFYTNNKHSVQCWSYLTVIQIPNKRNLIMTYISYFYFHDLISQVSEMLYVYLRHRNMYKLTQLRNNSQLGFNQSLSCEHWLLMQSYRVFLFRRMYKDMRKMTMVK